jgi:hypothetical protein
LLAESVAKLSDDAAALTFACDIVRELTKNGTLAGNPALVLRVSDETRPMVFSYRSSRHMPKPFALSGTVVNARE